MRNTAPSNHTPGLGYLKELEPNPDAIQNPNRPAPNFRGHVFYPEDKELLSQLQQKLGVEGGMFAYRLVHGRKLSVFGWIKSPPEGSDKAFGISITARPWKDEPKS